MKKHLICGDIHSNFKALKNIVDKYQIDEYDYVFLGDYCDYRGENPEENSDYWGVISIIMNIVKNYNGTALLGNHDDKLIRWFKGNNVEIKEGFDNTLRDINLLNETQKEEIYKFLISLPLRTVFDCNGIQYQCAHAYFAQEPEIFHNRLSSTPAEWKAYKDHALWGVPRKIDPKTGALSRVFYWQEDKYRNRVLEGAKKVAGHYHEFYNDDKFLILDGTPNVLIHIPEDNFTEGFI